MRAQPQARARRRECAVSMSWGEPPLSEFVRAVRAEGQDVLDEKLVVGEIRLQLRLLILDAEAAEFRRRPVEHYRGALRMERAVHEVEIVRAVIDVAGIEPVVARADAPLRH